MNLASTTAGQPPVSSHLLRVLGLTFAIAVGIGTVIGGGILRTPAIVLDSVGSLEIALALWIVVGVHALIQANVVCELMTALPKAGGLFVPAQAAFGAPGGLLVGWADWLGYVAAVGALAILSAEFLAIVLPALQGQIPLVAAAILLVQVAINWLGVRQGSTVQIVGSALKSAFLVVLLVLILFAPSVDPAVALDRAARPLTFAGVIVAYQTIFGAYAGWNNVAYFAEEDRDPGRNIPRGIFTTIVFVVLLYALICFALGRALPISALSQSSLPVADAVAPLLGPLAVKLIGGVAVVIAITCLNANLMGAPRILYGLASERLFPAIALRVNRGGTPGPALLVSGGVALALALTGEFQTIFLIMAAFGIVPLLVADFALFRLRRTMPDLERPYRARLYPWLPALALLLDMAMLAAFLWVDPRSGLFIVAAVAIALPIGWWMRRSRAIS